MRYLSSKIDRQVLCHFPEFGIYKIKFYYFTVFVVFVNWEQSWKLWTRNAKRTRETSTTFCHHFCPNTESAQNQSSTKTITPTAEHAEKVASPKHRKMSKLRISIFRIRSSCQQGRMTIKVVLKKARQILSMTLSVKNCPSQLLATIGVGHLLTAAPRECLHICQNQVFISVFLILHL